MSNRVSAINGWDIEAVSSPLFELDSTGKVTLSNHAFRALARRVKGEINVEGMAIASLFDIPGDYWLNLLSSGNFMEERRHSLRFLEGEGSCLLQQTLKGVSNRDGSPRFMVSWEILNENHQDITSALLEKRLADALFSDTDAFTVFYQPQFRFGSKTFVGLESLLRWDDEILGSVSPVDFIPAAERLGLIERLGEMVIDKVAEQIAEWTENDHVMPKVAINVSPSQLNSGRLIATLKEAFEVHDISPSSISIEVTEAVMMTDPTGSLNILSQIRAMGVKLSIDDFGTGYSSLSYLKDLPIDTVKIDRAFVTPLSSEEDAVDIVKAIITMAHSLGLSVIAEGVETSSQFDILTQLGCDVCQGFFMAKPMSSEHLIDFLKGSTYVAA